jgi:heme oxygenase
MSTSFVDELLERTADWRTQLSQNILYINLLGTNASEDDYKKYLSALYGFVSGFEQYIFPELNQFLNDIETRRKTKLITEDPARNQQIQVSILQIKTLADIKICQALP